MSKRHHHAPKRPIHHCLMLTASTPISKLAEAVHRHIPIPWKSRRATRAILAVAVIAGGIGIIHLIEIGFMHYVCEATGTSVHALGWVTLSKDVLGIEA